MDGDKLAIAVLLLLGARAGKPCPTCEEIIECTGLQRREVWPFIEQLQDRGLVEVETRGEGSPNVWSRMRQAGGPWTAWTARGLKPRPAPDSLA